MKQDMINISIGKHGDRERGRVIIMITFRTSESQPLILLELDGTL
jgi:hypothetical protein